MRILVGLGPGAGAKAALTYAASLSVRDRAQLSVLSAVTPPPVTIWWAQQLPENPWQVAQDACAARLRAAAQALPSELSVTTLLRRGNPSDTLVAELRRGGYDAVVVGASRRPARRLLRRAPVPVVVVPAAR